MSRTSEERPAPSSLTGARTPPGDLAGQGFLTEAEMQRGERENLLVILQRAGWRIKGANGAAELLGVKPTTLRSRMKKMGLERPS
ncbi:MAG: helix-turn-helix domain-containing protein [Limisphaerales bacterium]